LQCNKTVGREIIGIRPQCFLAEARNGGGHAATVRKRKELNEKVTKIQYKSILALKEKNE
jgi:hypothetical protein